MRCHSSTLISRMIRAGLRVNPHCTYRVIAAGIDHRNRIIDIATNTPSKFNHRTCRSSHAEERLIRRNPQSLSRVVVIRINRQGELLPIDPCNICSKLAEKRKIKIISGFV